MSLQNKMLFSEIEYYCKNFKRVLYLGSLLVMTYNSVPT